MSQSTNTEQDKNLNIRTIKTHSHNLTHCRDIRWATMLKTKQKKSEVHLGLKENLRKNKGSEKKNQRGPEGISV